MKRVKAKKLFLRIVSPLKQEVLRGWRDHVRALHGERDAALKRAAAKMMNRALAMTFSNWALFTDNVRSVRAMLRRNLAGKNLRIFLRWSEWAVQRAQARREVHAKGVLLDRGLERLRLRAVTYMQKVFRAYRQRVHAAALVVGARHARAREEETHRRAAEDTFVHDAVKGAMDGCAARLCHTRAGRRRVRSEMQRQWRASKGLPPKKKKKMAAKDGDAYNVGEESDSMLEIDATVAGAMHSVHVERELGGVEWPKGWLKKLVHRVRRRLAPSVRTIRALNTLLHEEALSAAAKDVVLFRRDRPPLFVCGGFDGGYGCREAFAVQADLDEHQALCTFPVRVGRRRELAGMEGKESGNGETKGEITTDGADGAGGGGDSGSGTTVGSGGSGGSGALGGVSSPSPIRSTPMGPPVIAGGSSLGPPGGVESKPGGVAAEDVPQFKSVQVRVVRATGLARADAFDDSDPYAVVSWLGAAEGVDGGDDGPVIVGRTKTIQDTLNPMWNTAFTVPLPPVVPSRCQLRIEVFDCDEMDGDGGGGDGGDEEEDDDFLGEVVLNGVLILNPKRASVSASKTADDGRGGTMTFTLKRKPGAAGRNQKFVQGTVTLGFAFEPVEVVEEEGSDDSDSSW